MKQSKYTKALLMAYCYGANCSTAKGVYTAMLRRRLGARRSKSYLKGLMKNRQSWKAATLGMRYSKATAPNVIHAISSGYITL